MNTQEETLAAYHNALAADDAYEIAIKEQFGQQATRWTQQPSQHNEETRTAYQYKQTTMGTYLVMIGDDTP